MKRGARGLCAVLAALACLALSGAAISPTAAALAGQRASQGPPTASPGELDLSPVASSRHREQIARVVESMDRTGAPPRGVVQGGRRGVFRNAERLLPQKPLGYWIESDVWPKKGPRDAERLVFGRGREVYWTRDHYQSFVRLR